MSGFRINLDLQGFAELKALWARAPEICQEEWLAAITTADLLLAREIQERLGQGGQRRGLNTGTLRGSITSFEQALPGNVIGVVGTPLSYAIPVELGTQPHFPPIAAILDWVRTKLGVPEAEAEGVAYRVARKIQHHGTEGVHMFRDGFAATRPQIQALLSRATERVVARLGGASA
jgi:hypothetical protein